jgi:hypothetical protein
LNLFLFYMAGVKEVRAANKIKRLQWQLTTKAAIGPLKLFHRVATGKKLTAVPAE